MSTSSRRGLLILTLALVGIFPPRRPPGAPMPGDDFETAKCPRCGEVSDSKAGKRFFCEYCGRYFKPR